MLSRSFVSDVAYFILGEKVAAYRPTSYRLRPRERLARSRSRVAETMGGKSYFLSALAVAVLSGGGY